MAFTQTQRIDEDKPRDEEILVLELDVMTQTSVPRCDVGRNGDGRLPPGKHVVKIYKSDLHCVDLKTEKYPAEVERCKREQMARRHDFIRSELKDELPKGYELPHDDAAEWTNTALPGLGEDVAKLVRSAAWRYAGSSWNGIYRESAATREKDGSKRGPGTIRSYKILDTLPPPMSADAKHAKELRDALVDAVHTIGATQQAAPQHQRNDRK